MKEIFKKPSLIGLISDINQGKSNTIYHIIETLRKDSEFSLVTFGLKSRLNDATEIFSLEELELIEDSFIVIDETFSLFDLDHRGKKRQIEQTLRLLHHKNNILLLSLLPENCKKFIASKLDVVVFKRCTLSDFINGSMVKRVITQYRGNEMGNTVLNIGIDQALVYDGNYKVIDIKYYPEYDSKKNNKQIIRNKSFFKKKAS
jgi:hypothetical protein